MCDILAVQHVAVKAIHSSHVWFITATNYYMVLFGSSNLYVKLADRYLNY